MPHIPRAFCADCAVEMPLEKGGVIVETRANGRGYYKILADRHTCSRCGRSILTGLASMPLTEHYMTDYAKTKADITVDFVSY